MSWLTVLWNLKNSGFHFLGMRGGHGSGSLVYPYYQVDYEYSHVESARTSRNMAFSWLVSIS